MASPGQANFMGAPGAAPQRPQLQQQALPQQPQLPGGPPPAGQQTDQFRGALNQAGQQAGPTLAQKQGFEGPGARQANFPQQGAPPPQINPQLLQQLAQAGQQTAQPRYGPGTAQQFGAPPPPWGQMGPATPPRGFGNPIPTGTPIQMPGGYPTPGGPGGGFGPQVPGQVNPYGGQLGQVNPPGGWAAQRPNPAPMPVQQPAPAMPRPDYAAQLGLMRNFGGGQQG